MPQPTTQQRRRCLRWYFAHGKDVPTTCKQFGISRATLYRWRARYVVAPEKPLRAQSRRPHRTRQPTYTPDELAVLADLAMTHPRWGRGRLRLALAAQTGERRSEATVGRMLALIMWRCPQCGGRQGQHDPRLHALSHDLARIGAPSSVG